MSNKQTGTALEEIAPEQVARWRSDVQSFFSTSWAEVQEVIEALEAETDPVPSAEVPASVNSPPTAAPPPATNRGEAAPTKSPAPAPSFPVDAGLAPANPPQRSSSAVPARSGPPQDARLAELARRIEERLRQSKS